MCRVILDSFRKATQGRFIFEAGLAVSLKTPWLKPRVIGLPMNGGRA